MVTHLENEPVLLAEARTGNSNALVTLLTQYDRYIYRLALNITGNRQDAEDVLQETFLKACTHLTEFRGESRFYTWLVSIAVNEGLILVRKRSKVSPISLDAPIETDDRSLMPREIEDWGENPEERCSRSELQSILDHAIENLEAGYRAVFLLRDAEGFSTEETAAMLGLSVPATKSRLLRARLKLREQLNNRFRKG